MASAPQVIYEDKDFLVINKPAGLLVHKLETKNYLPDGKAGKPKTLTDWLLENYPEVRGIGDDPQYRPGIVHRLDKDTSGVMLVCRNQPAFDYFKKLFQTHQIKKTYLALVYGELKSQGGIIEKPLGIKSGSMRRTIHLSSARMIKKAITRYRVKKVFEKDGRKYTLLEIEPETGRTHQIRVHLSSIGHPVIGDKLYGPKKQLISLSRQFLHAESLEFKTPAGARLKIAADLDSELAALADSLSDSQRRTGRFPAR